MSRLIPGVGPSDHVLGPPTAPITMVKYGDFECPFCGRAHDAMDRVLARMGKEIRFVYRHFPLAEIHPHAMMAAQAAEAAAAQGNFWGMYGMLYENQSALEYEDLVGYAEALSLDVGRFDDDLETERYLDTVKRDFESGIRSGVNGTPTFFINGERYDGRWDVEPMMAALRWTIERSQELRHP